MIDLSSNGLYEFPTFFNEFPALKVLRLIRNDITDIPESFFGKDNPQKNLQELTLNSNPIKQLPSNLNTGVELKVLGIAYTEITELPNIGNLEKLRILNVAGGNL